MKDARRTHRNFSVRGWSGKVFLFVACLASGLAFPGVAQETPPPSAPLLLILDASGSMWGQIEGENKIVIARRVVGQLVDDLDDDQEVGLIAYGHRREGDCDDIETVSEIGALDREGFKSTVNGLTPKGKTPITKSVQQAFESLASANRAATVILVSDGLETCGGDPCSAVRLAADGGLDFVLHVVGFDVAGEDTSSLQCAAQAGGGLFLSAESANELSSALERALALSADATSGRLVVKGIRNGELHDIGIVVTDQDGEMVAGARTYQSPDTNPSSIPLPDGVFDVRVQAMGIKGAAVREFQVEIHEGSVFERTEDFSTGEVSIGVTRNGELSDAVYKIKAAGTDDESASGRTYTSATHNPALVTITAGDYDVSVKSVEIESGPESNLERITVEPGERTDLVYAYTSGTLVVKVHRGEALVDALVWVSGEDGKEVAAARTYKAQGSNPARFVLLPGPYRIQVKEVRGPRTEFEFEAAVEAEATVEKAVDFDQL